jgi:hypothetical protein
MKFWEDGQLDVALSGVMSPYNLCILLHDDMDEVTIRPAVDVDVIQILETMQSSRPLPIHQNSPGDNVESGIASVDSSDVTLSDEFPRPDDYFDAPEAWIRCVASLDHVMLKHLIRTGLRYLSMFKSCHGSLRTNRCFDLIASEISSLKSLSPDLLCLLRHFSVRYFKPASQNSYWYRTNDYHFGWKDHSWILYSKPGYFLSSFLMTYRVYRQCHIHQSSHSHMINEVIRPGFINPRDACSVNAFIQLLFHILPLRLLIFAWSNRDWIISTVHLMFVAMSQDRLIDAVSLSTVCEPDAFDDKYCFELSLQISGALRDAPSGTLRDTIQQLFCSRQVTRISTRFSSRRVSDQHSFFWHLPVSWSSAWIECLNSCLRIIQFDAEPPQTQQNFICSFPRFFLLILGRHV